MLDLSKDPRCQSIEKKLDFYAEKARQWQIDRRRYVDHNYGNKFQFSDNKPYPYDDDTERRMLNDINQYLLTFDGQDRAQVNGHLLWKYKEYFSQPFAKHAIRLVTMSVMEHPLSDNDKAKFLEYIFSSGKQYEFDNFILYKLASFDPDKNPQINNRLYTKAIGYFDSHPRKNEKFVHLVYGMFKSFTGRVQQVSPEAVVNYAKIYFAMTERTSKKLSAAPLLRLLMKTPTALAEREQWGYDGIDTEAVNPAHDRRIYYPYSDLEGTGVLDFLLLFVPKIFTPTAENPYYAPALWQLGPAVIIGCPLGFLMCLYWEGAHFASDVRTLCGGIYAFFTRYRFGRKAIKFGAKRRPRGSRRARRKYCAKKS